MGPPRSHAAPRPHWFTEWLPRNYIRYHLERADVDPKTLTDDAVKRVFQASHGTPRLINQLCLQALIQAAVLGRIAIDGDFMASVIKAHPLFQNGRGGRR